MIFPAGYAEERALRQPWVTYGILGLCVALFLFTHLTGQRRLSQGLASLRQAVEFYGQHPYLKPDPRLREIVSMLERGDEPGQGRATPDPQFSNLEQVELDGWTRAGFDALEDVPQGKLGLVPSRYSLVGAIAHPFLHGGLLHLLVNMLFLYLSAPFLEDVWGRPFLAAFYVVAGFFSGSFFALGHPGLALPLLGASGATAAVIGALLVRHGRTKLCFSSGLGTAFRGAFAVPAWVGGPALLAWELAAAHWGDVLAPGIGGGAVAGWAHGSGLAFGVAVAAAVKRLGAEERWLRPDGARDVAAYAPARSPLEVSEGTRNRRARLAAGADEARLAWAREESTSLARTRQAGRAREVQAKPPPVDGPAFSVVSAVPVALEEGALVVELGGQGRRALDLGRIRALAAAVVGAEERMILDLFVGPEAEGGPPRAVRLDGGLFDARRLVPAEADDRDAFLSLAGALLAGSGATWILGGSVTRLSVYRSLGDYEADLRRALGNDRAGG